MIHLNLKAAQRVICLLIMTYQDSVVKLYCCGIFKEVLESGRESQQIIWDPSISHLREGVIHQPSIQTSNKSP